MGFITRKTDNDKSSAASEFARRWRFAELENLELMRARYITHSFSKHMHDTFVIGVVERGVEGFLCEGKTYVAPEGSIILVNPGEVHTGYSADTAPWTYRSFYPEPGQLLEAFQELSERHQYTPFFPSRVVQDKEVASKLLRAHEMLTGLGNLLSGQALLLETLQALILRHSDKKYSAPKIPLHGMSAVRAKEYLLAHIDENVSLSHLAQIARLSPTYLIRVFTKQFGMPPHTFLINARVGRAKELLRKNLPIAHVAFETGFADQSHLTRAFKRIVGVTPAQYC